MSNDDETTVVVNVNENVNDVVESVKCVSSIEMLRIRDTKLK